MKKFNVQAVFCLVFTFVAGYGYGETVSHGIMPANPVDSVSADSVATDSIGQISLGEVVVKSDLTRREGNRDIITVTKAMRDGTRNTGEMLGKVPGIFYNPLSTDLVLRGSKNVLILVDGVDKGVDYIKHLRPERFDKIEITYSPSGIYDGYDAVIDLHTRELYVGYEGFLLNEELMSPDGRNGVGNFLRNTKSIGEFTYTREKFNFYIDTQYSLSREGVSDYFTREYPLNGIAEITQETPYTHPNKNTRVSRFYTTLAMDFDFNPSHSVSAKVEFTPLSIRESYNFKLERTNILSEIMDTIAQSERRNDSDNLQIMGGLWYRGKIDSWRLNAYATFTGQGFDMCRQIARSSDYEINDDRRFSTKYFSGGVEANRTSDNRLWLFTMSDRLTYSRFSEKRLHTDIILSKSRNMRNTFNASVQYQGNNNISAGINAGFSLLNNSVDGISKTHISPKAGINVTWSPSDKFVIRFNYDMYTIYPGLSTLMSYGQFTDSLMYSQGNPALRTSLCHDISLSTTLFNSLTFEAKFNHIGNAIYDYYFTENGIIPSGADTYYSLNTFVNGRKTDWRLNLTYYKSFGSHWMISMTGSVRGIDARYGSVIKSKVFPDYSWYVNYNTMKGTLQFYLSGFMTPVYDFTPQNNSWYLQEANSLAVVKSFFNDRFEIIGMWFIPAYFSNGKRHGGVTSESYVTRYWANNQSRWNNTFKISIIYQFNGGKSVRKYNRESEAVAI